MSAIVSVKGLKKKIDRKQVLDGLDFEIEEGKVVGLLGENGAGKTTLMKILMNLFHADAGNVLICGKPVSDATKNHISYLPEVNHLFPWMTIRDVVHYYSDMFADFDINRSKELCDFLGINEADRIKNLSKGTKERVLIMLTFSRHAFLYLLDEPLGGIDPLTRSKIVKTIFSGTNGESAIFISTHQVKDVETLLDEVLFISNGKFVFSDSAENIRAIRGKSIEECYLEVFENAQAL